MKPGRIAGFLFLQIYPTDFNPDLTVPMWAYGAAFGLGVVLSIPLIWTTSYEIREDNLVYAKKNWGFVVAFAGIVLIRLLLRQELQGMDPQGQAALFMTVAFGYIIPWRIVSFIKFRRLVSRTAKL
ncbi:CcdC protein domain-containing protein [Paenibacillus chartarius]|uniref:CcdC protein domain-containing protein n=1 Tax=Paenibacillus chartarius TaxID=747481 RepID=A0ABV6DV72_9BACL